MKKTMQEKVAEAFNAPAGTESNKEVALGILILAVITVGGGFFLWLLTL